MSEKEKDLPRVGITIGDYNGIGPEVILKCVADARILHYYVPVIFGSPKVFSYYKKILELNELNLNYCKSADQINPRKVNLWVTWDEETQIKPGQADAIAGKYALQSLDVAVEAWKNKHIDVLVTAPLDKSTVNASDASFKGHTEYIADKLGEKPLMILCSEKLKVALQTGHIPLKEITTSISKDSIMQKVRMLNKSLMNDFGVARPRIAVLGLNPHAGDNGLLGKEDEEIIAPACKALQDDKIGCFGPYSADGFFASRQFEKFDGILAMYHDQGLIPFKYMAFEDGVNYTAGLSMVRTSPDHGTAYDIAGKGIASPASMQEAIFEAIRILNTRKNEAVIRENPLKFSSLKKERFRMEF